MAARELLPRRLAAKFDPPTIVLECSRRGTDKLCHVRVRLPALDGEWDARKWAHFVHQKLSRHVDSDGVSMSQLERHVQRILDRAGTAPAGARAAGAGRVSEEELRRAKALMTVEFSKNQVKPGDPGYRYDVSVEFGAPTQDNDWDEEDEEAEAAASAAAGEGVSDAASSSHGGTGYDWDAED